MRLLSLRNDYFKIALARVTFQTDFYFNNVFITLQKYEDYFTNDMHSGTIYEDFIVCFLMRK